MGTIVTSYGVQLKDAKPEDFQIIATKDTPGIPDGSRLNKSDYAIGYTEADCPTMYVFDGDKDQCLKMKYKIETFLQHSTEKDSFLLKNYEDEFPNSVLLAMEGSPPSGEHNPNERRKIQMRQVFNPIQLEDEHTVVFAVDERNPGGGCNEYVVFKKSEWETYEKPLLELPPNSDVPPSPKPLMRVQFQSGQLLEPGDLNGCFNEDLLVIVLDRLIGFSAGPYSCRETSIARTKIEEALHVMKQRKIERTRRGVQGKHQK